MKRTALPGRGWRVRAASMGLASLLLPLMMLTTTGCARAAELAWPGRHFNMVANEKRLADFLREFGASQGTTVVVDPKVEGVISGRFAINSRDTNAARKVLEDICSSYGLTWYYDGSLLYIEPASEAREELIPITPDSAGRIQGALQRLRIGDRRLLLQVSAADGHVVVAGPRRYVDAVRQVVRGVDTRNNMRDRSEVRFFPLRYAWANDFDLRRISGQGGTVPGVVSVLRSLFDPRNAPMRQGGVAGSGPLPMLRVGSNRPVRLPSGGSTYAPRLELPGAPAAPEDGGEAVAAQAPAFRSGELPQFQADTRMNAVLVRDLPERMDLYARVIEQMDRKPKLVEIEVTIMDITSDGLEQLGVDWRAHGSRADFQTGNGNNPPLTWAGAATAAGQTGIATPLGGLFTAAIGSEARNFLLARVSALATDGQASFVGRPKVLTLDNTEARLENKSEFYIKVPGFQDSSLYTVVAGTDVRVTPLIVDDEAHSVMLNINIGDDSVSTDLVDNVPVVRRRGVVTQAMIDEGKSVLLAGYSSEEKRNGKTGVPVLSSIPLLGNLFKYSEKKIANAERFYLLTPRLLGATTTPAPPPPNPFPPGPAPADGDPPRPQSAAPGPLALGPGERQPRTQRVVRRTRTKDTP